MWICMLILHYCWHAYVLTACVYLFVYIHISFDFITNNKKKRRTSERNEITANFRFYMQTPKKNPLTWKTEKISKTLLKQIFQKPYRGSSWILSFSDLILLLLKCIHFNCIFSLDIAYHDFQSSTMRFAYHQHARISTFKIHWTNIWKNSQATQQSSINFVLRKKCARLRNLRRCQLTEDIPCKKILS